MGRRFNRLNSLWLGGLVEIQCRCAFITRKNGSEIMGLENQGHVQDSQTENQ
jgi:hypothetical protein